MCYISLISQHITQNNMKPSTVKLFEKLLFMPLSAFGVPSLCNTTAVYVYFRLELSSTVRRGGSFYVASYANPGKTFFSTFQNKKARKTLSL